MGGGVGCMEPVASCQSGAPSPGRSERSHTVTQGEGLCWPSTGMGDLATAGAEHGPKKEFAESWCAVRGSDVAWCCVWVGKHGS